MPINNINIIQIHTTDSNINMASCFPFMKYIFILTLFIICFTLMFTENLEFLGLVLFFVVNVMYSAMIAMDLSAFLSQILGGNVAGQNWVILIAFIVIVALVLNFTSSVLTMMTLGNLYYKFGAKGNPIMLSPEYRLELNNIKGLFVSIIVLVTVLTLRLFLTPDQMANGMFESLNIIPDEVSRYGHFIFSIIAFALMTTIFHRINHDKEQKIDNVDVPEFPHEFKYNFSNLFFVLMGILLLYGLPFIIGSIWSGFGFGWVIPKNGIYEWFANKSKNFSIPVFEAFILIVSLFVMGISSKLRNINISNKNTYGQLSNIGIVFSVFLFCWTAFCECRRWFNKDDVQWNKDVLWLSLPSQNGIITLVSFVLLFTLLGVNTHKDSELHNDIFEQIDLRKTGEEYIFSKILVALLMLFPLGSFIMMIISYLTNCGNIYNINKLNVFGFPQLWDILSCIFKHMSSGFNISLIEVFIILKGILILLAFVFSGLTIKEYTKDVARNDKYKMYHSKYKFDIIFIFAMIFLMIVLVTSFFNAENFALLLGVSIEYFAPVIILIMASILVYYANDLAKLSKKEVLNDVQLEKKRQRELPDIGDKTAPVATSKTYDGTTHKI